MNIVEIPLPLSYQGCLFYPALPKMNLKRSHSFPSFAHSMKERC